MKFLLYGANGYTAQLMLDLMEKYSVEPVLAGRTEAKIKPLAEKHHCRYVIFDLNEHALTVEQLTPFEVVLHCAGPFIHTARPMIEACLEAGTHYLDITGEIPVFEMAKSYHQKALAAEIQLMPGVGFDVVPTDCMAARLANQLSSATHLELGFAWHGGGVSGGTARTMIENLGSPSMERVNGAIVYVPLAKYDRKITFEGKTKSLASIPWGDVATAFHTTGIPNIRTFMGMPPSQIRWARWSRYFKWVLQRDFVKNFFRQKIKKRAPGPNANRRAKAVSYI